MCGAVCFAGWQVWPDAARMSLHCHTTGKWLQHGANIVLPYGVFATEHNILLPAY
jgi:hypothetical protein